MENNYIVVNGELYHWGVKGMRWGVRRYQNKDGTLTKAGKKRYNNDAEEKSKVEKQAPSKVRKKKRVSEMSDAELRSEINRIQMERQYAQLTARHVSAGEKFVKNVAMTAASNVANKYATKGLEFAAGKAEKAIKERYNRAWLM